MAELWYDDSGSFHAEIGYDALGNPATAIDQRAQLERYLDEEYRGATAEFLRRALALVQDVGGMVTAGELWRSWEFVGEIMADRIASSFVLSDEMRNGVWAEWKESTAPDDAYAAIRAVFQNAGAEGWTPEETYRQVSAVHSLEGVAVRQEATSLTASAGEDSIDIGEGLMAAGLTWLARAKRSSRLNATALSSAARQARIRVNRVEQKRWVTRHDERVRDSHAEVDGQTIGTEDVFIVGGSPMRYPGDRQGEYGERVNCRCVIVGVVPRGWRGRSE